MNKHERGVMSVFDNIEIMNKDASLERLLAMFHNAADEYCDTQNQGLFIPVVFVDTDKLMHKWLLSKHEQKIHK